MYTSWTTVSNKSNKALLKIPGHADIELPILTGSLGPKVLDITRLYKEANVFTYDPGFTSTGSCKSNITFIDGEKGKLLHRGYDIEELATKTNFLETAYLLMYGDLPNIVQKTEFIDAITTHTMLNETRVKPCQLY